MKQIVILFGLALAGLAICARTVEGLANILRKGRQ
jgi:hypothetical protein